jgi:FeS assembly protein IscX
MRWTDTYAIADALIEAHPDVDPLTLRFTDLMAWVMALPGFDDTEENCSERILEAIQMTWVDEL